MGQLSPQITQQPAYNPNWVENSATLGAGGMVLPGATGYVPPGFGTMRRGNSRPGSESSRRGGVGRGRGGSKLPPPNKPGGLPTLPNGQEGYEPWAPELNNSEFVDAGSENFPDEQQDELVRRMGQMSLMC